MTYTHFTFTSGANPYITITPRAKTNLIRRLRRRGYKVTRERLGWWIVNDRKGATE